jgi:hypothetical protein
VGVAVEEGSGEAVGVVVGAAGVDVGAEVPAHAVETPPIRETRRRWRSVLRMGRSILRRRF